MRRKIFFITFYFFLSLAITGSYFHFSSQWIAYAKAKHYYNHHQYERSIYQFFIAIEKGADIFEVFDETLDAIKKSKNYSCADTIFNYLLKRKKCNLPAFRNLGEFLIEIKNYPLAIKVYEYIVKKDKTDILSNMELGSLYTKQGKYYKAIKLYTKVRGDYEKK